MKDNKQYTKPVVDVIEFSAEDVILTSGEGTGTFKNGNWNDNRFDDNFFGNN